MLLSHPSWWTGFYNVSVKCKNIRLSCNYHVNVRISLKIALYYLCFLAPVNSDRLFWKRERSLSHFIDLYQFRGHSCQLDVSTKNWLFHFCVYACFYIETFSDCTFYQNGWVFRQAKGNTGLFESSTHKGDVQAIL